MVKTSATLGREARYTKQAHLTRLPAFLTVDFVRFYYKKKEQTNCKVLKDCKFPLALDVHELCAPALQARLAPERDAFKAWTDHKTELAVSDALAAAAATAATAAASAAAPSGSMDVDAVIRPSSFADVCSAFYFHCYFYYWGDRWLTISGPLSGRRLQQQWAV